MEELTRQSRLDVKCISTCLDELKGMLAKDDYKPNYKSQYITPPTLPQPLYSQLSELNLSDESINNSNIGSIDTAVSSDNQADNKCEKDEFVITDTARVHVYMDFEVNRKFLGRVIMKLYTDTHPITTENFRCLSTGEKGFGYKNNKIHRIVKNFVVQGGDFTTGDGTGGRSIYAGTKLGDMWGKFKDELPFLPHDKAGILSMANSGKNTNSSQFFITMKPCPKLDGKHVAFGEVVHGFEYVEEISQLDASIDKVIIVDCNQL